MSEGFRQMQSGETCQPIMDGYRMKCCDCGLVHLVKFRAIRVARTLPDGSFEYDELDPAEYRIEMSMTREDEQ